MGQAVGELGATLNAALVVIGDRLGLYKAMAGAGALTPAELAERTGTSERYVREWLNAQAAGGYVTYADGRYTLPPEHAVALADEDSPAFLPGAFQLMTAAVRDEPKITEAFRSGAGVGWHEHIARPLRGLRALLPPRLRARTSCSPGSRRWTASRRSCARARAWPTSAAATAPRRSSWPRRIPNSTFVGFDYHVGSIEARARAAARSSTLRGRLRAGLPRRGLRPGDDVRLPARHGRPGRRRAATSASRSAQDGTWLIVEPFAGDRVEDNLNPVGRVYYAASTLVCTPASLVQEVGLALGAQAGEARLRDVVRRRRLHALPARRRDALQPGARGAAVIRSRASAGAREQSRARYPDVEGYVERDGVRVFYEVYGDGDPTILLLPTWSIIHSRHWKAQIPYLARHFRVVTFDGRGNGKSDRPQGVAPYLEHEFVADALAVMDATGTENGRARGAVVRGELDDAAGRRPSRARAGGDLHRPGRPARARPPGARDHRPLRGGARHATTAGRSTTATTGSGTTSASSSSSSRRCSPSRTRPSRSRTASAGRWRPTRRRWPTRRRRWASAGARSSATIAARVRCPVLVIHGDRDLIRPHAQGAALAELTGGDARDAARAPATGRRRATR